MSGGKSNPARGAYFERRVKKSLEAAGHFVMKAGGSKGPCDLWVARHLKNHLWVQCKVNRRIDPAERELLVEKAEHYNLVPVLAWRDPKNKIRYQIVEVEGLGLEFTP